MNWIKRIEIESLFDCCNISWNLSERVSILSGGNGTGKSTLLRSLTELLTLGYVKDDYAELYDQLIVTFSDNTAVSSRRGCDVSQLKHRLRSNFVVDSALTCEDGMAITDENLISSINRFLEPTSKRAILGGERLEFEVGHSRRVPLSRMSSGEKELVRILRIAAESQAGDVIVLDEPEVSLHFDWQKELLRELEGLGSPDKQLLLSTHSPAIIMQGWMANVVHIESVIKEY